MAARSTHATDPGQVEGRGHVVCRVAPWVPGSPFGLRGRFHPGNVWPIKLELVRTTLLVALAVLFLTPVLPAMLELAAAPFR